MANYNSYKTRKPNKKRDWRRRLGREAPWHRRLEDQQTSRIYTYSFIQHRLLTFFNLYIGFNSFL